MYFVCFFFFSSRRRHTRLTCDWSSDVCSSDLLVGKRVELRTQFLRGECDVPRSQLPQPEIGAGEALELGVVLARVRQCPSGEVLEKGERRLGRVGHLWNQGQLSE